jgi:hypothetical protein
VKRGGGCGTDGERERGWWTPAQREFCVEAIRVEEDDDENGGGVETPPSPRERVGRLRLRRRTREREEDLFLAPDYPRGRVE